MHFWLKFLHIALVGVWFTGLFFLPRLLKAYRRGRAQEDPAYFNRVTNVIFFRIATPAAVLAILVGMSLMFFAPPASWLILKLTLVAGAVLVHAYIGMLLYEMSKGNNRHGPVFFSLMGWVPLVLLLGIGGLTAAKPDTLPPLPAPPSQGPGPLPGSNEVELHPSAERRARMRGQGAGGDSSSSAASGSNSP